MSSSLDIQSKIIDQNGSPTFVCSLHNQGNESLYILSGQRMPYLLHQDDGSLLVLQGLHPGDPDVDYFGLEVPGTFTLEPGGQMDISLVLEPLQQTEHYALGPLPLAVDLPVNIRLSVGLVPEPIDPAKPQHHSVESILAVQELVEGPVVEWGN